MIIKDYNFFLVLQRTAVLLVFYLWVWVPRWPSWPLHGLTASQRSSPNGFRLGKSSLLSAQKRKILLVLVAVSALLYFSSFSKETETVTPASKTPPRPPLSLLFDYFPRRRRVPSSPPAPAQEVQERALYTHHYKETMALASPVDYAGTITSSQRQLSFVMPRCNGLQCVGYENKSRAASHLVVRAMSMDRPKLDFSNSNWKDQFQEDFSRRFRLPHLTDIIDVESRPTTFSLNSRAPLENVNGSSEESWNGYVNDDDRALLKVIKFASPTSAGADCIDPDCSWVEQWVHRAGPRKQIYFEPQYVKAGIVTCGGLCPGLNDVIRQIVLTLEKYEVKNIVGIQHGFRGFFEDHLAEVALNRHVVQNINLAGGSFLGVSRGGASISDIVDSIQARRLDMLFVLGGNGTHAGADAIHDECRTRKLKVSIIGVPKTIDNDILLMDKTFGFDTAVEAAQRAINSAYIEAHSAFHGIGLVKLMGRSSGFITMHASLSSGQVDICLIPEVPFTLDGPNGVLRHLEHLIETKGFALMCVAEGAGQEYLQKSNATDASGNMVLSDIGVHLQQKIKSHFREINVHSDVKYIDPTYMLRAVRANASDAILCTVLGQNAVHGAFAGFGGITTGICNTHNVYLPIPEVIKTPRLVDPNSRMWHRCLTSTGQPDFC